MRFTDLKTVGASDLPLGVLESEKVTLYQGNDVFRVHGQRSCPDLVGNARAKAVSAFSAYVFGPCHCAENIWPLEVENYLNSALQVLAFQSQSLELKSKKRNRKREARASQLAFRLDGIVLDLPRPLVSEAARILRRLRKMSCVAV